jgi:hypothetical protein
MGSAGRIAPVPADPAPALSVVETAPQKTARRLRLTAVCAAAASALLVASYALPWIELPQEERQRIDRTIRPRIEELRGDQPELAAALAELEKSAVERGHLTGVDVYRYARNAHALNRSLTGQAPPDASEDRPWQVQRALFLGEVVLVALPFAAGALVLLFLVQRFRRADAAPLTLLVLTGCVGAAMALAWMRFAESLGAELFTGLGLRLALAATLLQASIGLVGVTKRNWWRVYAGSLASVGVLGVLAWAYVWRGLFP